VRARFIIAYNKLASLPIGRQIHARLELIHARLDSRLADRAGLLGKLWRMLHQPDWQESTLMAGVLSVACTVLILLVAPQTGHRWLVSIGAGLVIDLVMYFFYKLGLWKKRQVGYIKSGVLYWAWIVAFFFINGIMNWLWMRKLGFDTVPARGLLAAQGAVLNPVVFAYRKRIAFATKKMKTTTA